MFHGYNKKGEVFMTKKRTEVQQSLNAADSLWDGWLNSFKTLRGFQTEIDEKSLQAIDKQKEILNSTREIVSKIEDESNKKTAELKASLQNTMKTIERDQVGSTVSNWMNQIEVISNSVQALSWPPSEVVFDIFSDYQDQWESSFKEALGQQQQARFEVLKTMENLTEQMKQTQKGLLPSI